MCYFSIIGVYVTFVWVIGKLIRLLFVGNVERIMFEELPDVDKILLVSFLQIHQSICPNKTMVKVTFYFFSLGF